MIAPEAARAVLSLFIPVRPDADFAEPPRVGDWSVAYDYARRLHAGLPFLVALERSRFAAELPEEIRLQFASELRKERVILAALDCEREFAEGVLDRAGIPVMPLKGMDLGRHVYPEAILRPMRDVDLLVTGPNYARAIAVLAREGYQEVGGSYPGRFRTELSRGAAYPVIELHHRLLESDRERDLEDLWARAGSRGRLCPEDQVSYLIRHAAVQHALESPIWLSDLHYVILRQGAELDWGRIFRGLQEKRALSGGLLVALLLTRSCRSPVPAPFIEQLEQALGPGRARALRGLAEAETWFRPGPLGAWALAWRRFWLRDSLGEALWYAARRARRRWIAASRA